MCRVASGVKYAIFALTTHSTCAAQTCTVSEEERTDRGLKVKSCTPSDDKNVTIKATTECGLQCLTGFFASTSDLQLKCKPQPGDQVLGETQWPESCKGDCGVFGRVGG